MIVSLRLLLHTALLACCLLLLSGCHPNAPQTPAAPASAKASTPAELGSPRFADVTKAAGLHWIHNPCRTGKKFLPETVGGGGGFLDYDRDGNLDILLINGAPLPGYHGPVPHLALYRNNGNGTFTDVTQESGLNVKEYGIGLAVGDYDNDGWPDLYITTVGRNRLFHNELGKRTDPTPHTLHPTPCFRDVTARAGVGVTGFSTAAAWIDYDHDGRLDLYVGRYVEWTPETDLPCGPANARQYCPPYQYQAAKPVLFHNRGAGTFEDVSEQAGVRGHYGKTLAVVPCDVNGDGWPDLYVANDTEPDLLLINGKNGTFSEQGTAAGIAVGTDGNATGSMGVDIATPFNDGRVTIAVGCFAGQELSLFEAQAANAPGELLFDNRKREAGIADPTHPMTTFGLAFADVDLDGWPDLLVLNGHIDDDPSLHVSGGQSVPYRQKPQLFQNRHDGTFQDVAEAAGIATPLIGRGLAVGDYDNDGRPDCLVFENGGPVRLWHNETQPVGSWLGVELVGSKSPRDGTGAVVTLSGPGWTQSLFATTARSYLSACDPRIHFGVGRQAVEQLTVRWPSGKVTTLPTPPLHRYIKVEEGQ